MKKDRVKRGRARGAMSPKELKELAAAVEDLSKWLTDKLKGNTQYGAYSMSVLGEEAVTYFTERAVMTFFKGNWKRKKNETLREFLGRMVISDMGHAQRDYKNKGEVMIRSMDDDQARLEAVEQATLEWEEGLERLELAREVAYDIAAERVRNDPELTMYLKTMYDHNSYRDISRKLRITIAEVKNLETELLRSL
jgi:hypothetical protein